MRDPHRRPRQRRLLLGTAAGILAALVVAAAAEAKIAVIWTETYDVVPVPALDQADLWVREMFVFDDQLYLVAVGDSVGDELWRFDGNTVSLAADINPGPEGSVSRDFVVFDGELYFSASHASYGIELWRYDGSAASLAADVLPGPADGYVKDPTVFGGALYFFATDQAVGDELWKYDGSTATLVADLNSGPFPATPSQLASVGDALLFTACNDAEETALWRYNGTALSSITTFDQNECRNVTWNRSHIVHAGAYFFTTPPDKPCGMLCRYDGAAISGVPGVNTELGFPNRLTELGDALYFVAKDDQGVELWRYANGFASRYRDIYPGERSSVPTELTLFDDNLFFTASDDASGPKLYSLSGPVAEVVPARHGFSPNLLTAFRDALYFRTSSGSWRLEQGSSRMTGVYAELEPLFDAWWEWPIEAQQPGDAAAATAAFVAFAEGQEPRLLARRELDLERTQRTPELLYTSPEIDGSSLAPAMAFASVVLHEATGRAVQSEIEVVSVEGALDARTREQLEGRAEAFLANLTSEGLRAMEIHELQGAEPTGVERPGVSDRGLILATALLALLLGLVFGTLLGRRVRPSF